VEDRIGIGIDFPADVEIWYLSCSLYFPKFKLKKMRKIRAFQGWFIIMRVRFFGQSRIKISGKKRKTANSGDFILPILTRFWKGRLQ